MGKPGKQTFGLYSLDNYPTFDSAMRRRIVNILITTLARRVSLKADRTTAHDRTAGLWCGRAVGAR